MNTIYNSFDEARAYSAKRKAFNKTLLLQRTNRPDIRGSLLSLVDLRYTIKTEFELA